MLLKRDELRRNKNQQNYIREKLAHYLRINRRFCYIKEKRQIVHQHHKICALSIFSKVFLKFDIISAIYKTVRSSTSTSNK